MGIFRAHLAAIGCKGLTGHGLSNNFLNDLKLTVMRMGLVQTLKNSNSVFEIFSSPEPA